MLVTKLLSQPEVRQRVELKPLTEDRHRNPGLAEDCFIGAAAGEAGDMDIELRARQSRGQQHELLFRTGLHEGRDEEFKVDHAGLSCGSSIEIRHRTYAVVPRLVATRPRTAKMN